MSQRWYAVAFAVVLLAACAGAFFGGRFLFQQLEGNGSAGKAWSPPGQVDAAATAGAVAAGTVAAGTVAAGTPSVDGGQVALATPQAAATKTGAAQAGAKATATHTRIPSPVAPTVELPTATFTPLESPTPEATEIPAATAAPTAPPFPFILASPPRDSAGDCPGNYILGMVTDAAAKPLPDVKLLLVDEYGNQQFKTTKSGSDAGRYDFPLFGPPRHFYVTVVDAANQPLSQRIDVPHGVGPDPKATCHTINWLKSR